MKLILAQLVTNKPLSLAQAIDAFEQIMTGQATPAQIAALLSLIAHRGPTHEELLGAATVMRHKVVPVLVPAGMRVIDTCGTGGTGSKTFNISTTAGLVAAAAGRARNVGVAKHGNRAVTSTSGSSQVLEHLGVKLRVQPETLTRCLDEAGFCFCFAPAHHPAMKYAGPVRAELGFATLFNRLGPLTNPAGALQQVMGVSSIDHLEPTARVLRDLGATHAMTLNCPLENGGCIGELLTTGPSHIAHLHKGEIRRYEFDPASLGLPRANLASLCIESPQQSAEIVRGVLAGKHSPARDVVLLNAAAALVVADAASDFKQGLAMATDAIDTGAAQRTLDTLVKLTTADPTPQI